MKAVNLKVTVPFLKLRIGSGKFGVSKWIQFCEDMLGKGREVYLTEAQNTVSKYITIYGPFDLKFKVRFSNHKPIKLREAKGDCDFFVGITNFGVTSIEDAIKVTEEYFNVGKPSGEASRGPRQETRCENKEESTRGAA